MPRELLTMTGTYAQFEGTNIVAENCLSAKVRDLVIKGKTYQNLIKPTSFTVNAPCTLFGVESSTIYTIIVKNNSNTNKQLNYAFYNGTGRYYDNTLIRPNSDIGIYKKIITTRSDTTDLYLYFVANSEGETMDTSYKNVVLLEGDYTNIDLPNRIDGIESVAERENNILSIKINDYIVSNINLPIPLRSLPNGVADTIEGNTLVQRVGKIVLDESNANNFKQVNNIQVFRWDYFFDTKYFVSGICDRFLVKNVETLANENKGIRLSGNNFRCMDIKFPNDTGFDINTFRTWLSKNPVTVWYELATPVIHDLEIPSINTVSKTNTITTSNNIKPVISCKLKLSKARITS